MKERWEDCSGVIQAKLLAYDQIATHDDIELAGKLGGIRV